MACRLQWYWSYKLGYRSRKRNINLTLGDGIHQALAAYYKDKANPIEVFIKWADREISKLDENWTADRETLAEAKELGEAMLESYLEEYRDNDYFDVLRIEESLNMPLKIPGTDEDSPYSLTSRLDGLVRDRNSGRLFSLEHKTYTRFEPAHLEMDHQITSQIFLGRHLAEILGIDEKVVGVIYNGLRKVIPTGRTSAPLFHRQKIFRTSRQMEVFLHRAYWQAREFKPQDGSTVAIYPQPESMRCGRCDFRDACKAYQEGNDYKLILKEYFTSRKQRDSYYAKRRGSNRGGVSRNSRTRKVARS